MPPFFGVAIPYTVDTASGFGMMASVAQQQGGGRWTGNQASPAAPRRERARS
jgi:hypothetical protein